MDSNRNKFWVQTFGNVVRYIRERNDVSVSETAGSSSRLTVSVTHNLDNSIFNFPITIRRPLPSGWTMASAFQDGQDLGAQIVNVNGTQYIMFDAVPNAGNVTITTGDGVVFYQHYYYGGAASQTLGAGSYTISQLAAKGMPNDWASSVRIPNGYTVTLYQHDNFTGTSWTLTGDTPEFGSFGANDQASSVVVEKAFDGVYKIVARHSGKAIDSYNFGTENGTPLVQWPYWGGTNQQWQVTHEGNGEYSIVGVHSGKCIDIANWDAYDGAAVQLYSYWGGTNQKYYIIPTDSGYYSISPTHAPEFCLDVSGISQDDGALIHLWTWLGGTNQQWAFQAP
jgi:hypothetical protein